MLKEFKNRKEVPVGITGGRYVVTDCGKIKDTLTKTTINSESTELVEIVVDGKNISVKPELVIAMGFKPMYRSEAFWTNWTILFEDGNNKNFHPSNLLWKPPFGGQACLEKEGFFVIPSATEFAVSHDGSAVYSRHLKRLVNLRRNIKKKKQKGYYLVFNGRNDAGNSRRSTISVHRAVSLAMHAYDETVDDITVNHKNGIKNDNRPDNLEWTTYAENNIHAKDTGLCNSRIPVYIKDYKTGEITRYKSMTHAGLVVGYDGARMVDRMRYRPDKLIKFRYYPSFTNTVDSWPTYDWDELKRAHELSDRRKESLGCAAYCIYTKQTYIASSTSKLREFIKLTKDQVNTGISTESVWPTFNYIFWSLHSPKAVRVFQKDELIAFKDRSGIKKPLRVTYSDGSTKVFVNISECAEFLSIKISKLQYSLDMYDVLVVDGKIVKFIQP